MLRRTLILSALVHFGLFFILLPRRIPSPIVDERLRIVELEPSLFQGPLKQDSPLGNPRGNGKSKLRFLDLGIEESGVPLAGQELGTRFAYGSGSGSGVLEKLGGTVTYEGIHHRIEEALSYPSELVERDIEGTVRATLVFSPRGEWLKAKSQVQSVSPYLRVHVIRLLRSIFSESLPQNYFNSGLGLRLICVFKFDVVRKEANVADSGDLKDRITQAGVLGNRLYFSRSDHLMGMWKVGPIRGYGFLPAISIDAGELASEISGVLGQESNFDPLRKYREDPDWKS